MKAAVFRAIGQPLVIEEVPTPRPGRGEMILKVAHCGICGTDLHSTETAGSRVKLGSVLGHEFCGEVVEIGPESAQAWKEGDRVVSLPFMGCGHCAQCAAGQPLWCRQMRDHAFGTVPGAFAEYVRVGTRESVRLPASVSWREGALVEPLAVGLHGVHRARLDPGADVLVVGAGPVGLAVVIWARALGARNIIVTSRSNRRADLARTLGATEFIESDRDVRREFRKIAGGPPAAVFECVGAPGTLDLCIGLAPARGKVVVLGECGRPDIIQPTVAMSKELSIDFALAYGVRDFEIAVDMLARGRIDPSSMITDVVGFDGFPALFEELRQSRTQQCKVLLQPA